MSWAECDQYGQVKVGLDLVGSITIGIGTITVHVMPDDAPRVRDDLSQAITELARRAGLAVQSATETRDAIDKAARS